MTTAHRRAIETVFLDAGGVLVHPNWVRVAAALTAHGVAADADRLIAAEPHAKLEMDRASVMIGTDDQRRGWIYFDTVLRHAGITADAASDRALAEMRAYHDVHNLWEYVADDVVPALQALRALDLRLVVVSNANGTLRALLDRVGLAEWFDVVLDSHEWKVEKPDPRLFHLALAESGADAATTVHVGDFFHIDIDGARAAGLAEAVLLDPAGLYPEADCRRIARLPELAGLVAAVNGVTRSGESAAGPPYSRTR